MDVSDLGSQQEEFLLESALNEQAKKPRLMAMGKCLNCDEVVAVGLFCDADCRDDFELRAKSAALNKGL